MQARSNSTAVDHGIDPARYRHVLGHFCSGVTIVTAMSHEPEPPGPVGFTCQSFAALSLDPPLVVFSVGRGSRSWPRIEHSGAFCVNILTTEQEALSRVFAISGADKFAGIDWSPSLVTGSPRLPGSLAWVEGTVEAVHPGGDHHIVIGRVRALDVAESDTPPLLFYASSFRQLRHYVGPDPNGGLAQS